MTSMKPETTNRIWFPEFAYVLSHTAFEAPSPGA